MSGIAELDEALARRSKAQGVITRHSNSIKRILQGSSTEDLSQLGTLLEKLREARDRYSQCHSAVVVLCDQHSVEKQTHEVLLENVDAAVDELCEEAKAKCAGTGVQKVADPQPEAPSQDPPLALSPGTTRQLLSLKSLMDGLKGVSLEPDRSAELELAAERKKHQKEKDEWMSAMADLRTELAGLRAAIQPSRASSSPQKDGDRRVTFGLTGRAADVSTIACEQNGQLGSAESDGTDIRSGAAPSAAAAWPPPVRPGPRMGAAHAGQPGNNAFPAGPQYLRARAPTSTYPVFFPGNSASGYMPGGGPNRAAPRGSVDDCQYRRYPFPEHRAPLSWPPSGQGPSVSFAGQPYGVGDVPDCPPPAWAGPDAYSRVPFGGDLSMYLDASTKLQQSVVAQLRAPPVSIPKFEGNPLDYTAFINAFTEVVEENGEGDRARLMSLIAHCEGRALAAIRGCTNLTAAEGYRTARDRLARKFGSPFLISQAWMEKLMSYGDLQDPDLLDSFSSDLVSCRDSLKSLGYLSELACTNSIRSLVAKLPFTARTRWRREHRQGVTSVEYDPLSKLIEVVRDAADDVTDPAYSERVIKKIRGTYAGSGAPGSRGLRQAGYPLTSRRGAVNCVQEEAWNEDWGDCESPVEEAPTSGVFLTAGGRPACAVCGASHHFTSRCRSYKELNPADRLSLVRDKKLCELCLAQGHAASTCPLPWKCQDRGCGLKHHTSLHHAFTLGTGSKQAVNLTTMSVDATDVCQEEPAVHSVNAVSVSRDIGTEQEAGLGLDDSRHVSLTVPTLPLARVVIRHGSREVTTFALLDNASTMTMCHESVRTRLALEPHAVNRADVSTVTGVSEIKGGLVSFEVASSKTRDFLPCFDATLVKDLPISLYHLATAKNLTRWEHLRNLPLEESRAGDVHLLIGTDNAHLLEPDLKVKGKGRFDPYALLTPLGWTVYGCSAESSARASAYVTVTTRCSRVACTPPPDVVKPREDAENVPVESVESVFATPSLDGKQGDAANLPSQDRDRHAPVAEQAEVVTEDFAQRIARFWQVEALPEAPKLSRDERMVLDLWEREWRLVDGKIELPIPYRQEPPLLPNNKQIAIRAFMSMIKRKSRQELEQYITAMRTTIGEGYAEEVTDEMCVDIRYLWFLLHHGVDHPRKPNVTRVVNNAGAKFRGVSLNDLTFPGPDLLNKLVEVSIRWRRFDTGTAMDIESMFNQVLVPTKQRDSLSFVFWKDCDPSKPLVVYRMTRHIFGAVWAPAAALFALRKTAQIAPVDIPPQVRKSVENDFYMDDWVDSQEGHVEAREKSSGVVRAVASGGFKLGKLASNSRELLAATPPSVRAKELAGLDPTKDRLPVVFSLGTGWDLQTDEITYAGLSVQPEPTRRGLTSATATVFDPMGFLAPFLMPAKVLMREACRPGSAWDELLPDRIQQPWGRWLLDAQALPQFRLERWLGCSDGAEEILHVFGDASERSYGSAGYVCVRARDTGIVEKASLITAKSKLAPKKTLQIPRLELCAAVMAVDMGCMLVEVMGIEFVAVWYWTDSELVMRFILADPSTLKTFMANRVSHIQQRSRAAQWRHVPGVQNPADLITRGASVQELNNSSLWKHGPAFIRETQDKWPIVKIAPPEDIDRAELKPYKPVYMSEAVSVSGHEVARVGLQAPSDGSAEPSRGAAYLVAPGPREGTDISAEVKVKGMRGRRLITPLAKGERAALENFLSKVSGWTRNVRLVAAWLRLRCLLLKRNYERGSFTARELEEAKLAMARLNQRCYISEERARSRAFQKMFPVDSGGLWRVGGRLQNAALTQAQMHPVLLPEDCPMTEQLIEYTHKYVGHASSDRVLVEIRKGYWILNGRVKINRMIGRCMTCRRLKAKPPQQLMAPLPQKRVDFGTPPFTHTGVDYFGPLTVVVKRSSDKRYGSLFTCMTTRAVHLELVTDLSTSAFLDAFSRFVARRGKPRSMQSDNGTNFVGARKVICSLKPIVKGHGLQKALADQGIEWTLNTPGGSHQGGVWERLIRSVRELLMVLVGDQRITAERLQTTLCLIELLINNRPLTRLSDDPESLAPITPSQILHLKPTGMPLLEQFSGDRLRKDWGQAQYLASQFWHRWTSQYMPELQRRTKWTKIETNVKVGELILIASEQTPRNTWPLARVVDTFPGSDGCVRNVQVKTATGTYRRPITKIVRLEADDGIG